MARWMSGQALVMELYRHDLQHLINLAPQLRNAQASLTALRR